MPACAWANTYFADRPKPRHPKDLVGHICINFRLQTSGGFYQWEFEENGREIKIRVEGQLAFSNSFDVVEATLDGFGLSYMMEEIVRPHIAEGRLVHVLKEYSPYWDPYYLYYLSRRQSSPAFVALVDFLRYRD